MSECVGGWVNGGMSGVGGMMRFLNSRPLNAAPPRPAACSEIVAELRLMAKAAQRAQRAPATPVASGSLALILEPKATGERPLLEEVEEEGGEGGGDLPLEAGRERVGEAVGPRGEERQ